MPFHLKNKEFKFLTFLEREGVGDTEKKHLNTNKPEFCFVLGKVATLLVLCHFIIAHFDLIFKAVSRR